MAALAAYPAGSVRALLLLVKEDYILFLRTIFSGLGAACGSNGFQFQSLCYTDAPAVGFLVDNVSSAGCRLADNWSAADSILLR